MREVESGPRAPGSVSGTTPNMAIMAGWCSTLRAGNNRKVGGTIPVVATAHAQVSLDDCARDLNAAPPEEVRLRELAGSVSDLSSFGFTPKLHEALKGGR